MSVATQQIFTFDDSFARELEGLYVPWEAAAPPAPQLLALNEELAAELGADPRMLAGPEGFATLSGHPTPPGATPIAMAYAGHQFGGYSPRLGDGRALLLGEINDSTGRRRDLHLKGSGRTPFARGGDGKAAVGPMLREHLIGEAMHGLGIPTSRSLAVVATGEDVARETILPGAILARVAASHIRVGTFQYAAAHPDPSLLERLSDYSIARHYPEAAEADDPHLAFFEAVVEAQASLIARWMLVGFVHGVMNTDNMAISGESLDYGPCAFMDAFDPGTVFSSIDHGGRYAYGNQPAAASWNLARFGEALLGLLGNEPEDAQARALEVLKSFPDRFRDHWRRGMNAKLGLLELREGDDELRDDLLALLHSQGTDFTAGFRALSACTGEEADASRAPFADPAVLDSWLERWHARLGEEDGDAAAIAARMNRVNPVYIPRNHLVEEALGAGTAGDLASFERLVDVVRKPFEERPGLEDYAIPPVPGSGPYRTFCGT